MWELTVVCEGHEKRVKIDIGRHLVAQIAQDIMTTENLGNGDRLTFICNHPVTVTTKTVSVRKPQMFGLVTTEHEVEHEVEVTVQDVITFEVILTYDPTVPLYHRFGQKLQLLGAARYTTTREDGNWKSTEKADLP